MSAGAWASAFDHNWAGPLLYTAMVWCVLVWALRFLSQGGKAWVAPKMLIYLFWFSTGAAFFGQTVRTILGWFNP